MFVCVDCPQTCDQLKAKGTDMEKALLSCDITTEVQVKREHNTIAVTVK